MRAMFKTATAIVQALGGTNKAARFFGVRPPSVSNWLEKDVIPDERLIPFAARLEKETAGQFSRIQYWPEQAEQIWPDLGAGNAQAVV